MPALPWLQVSFASFVNRLPMSRMSSFVALKAAKAGVDHIRMAPLMVRRARKGRIHDDKIV